MTTTRRTAFAIAAAFLLPAPALAAGGAHIIDDASVETPGGCHLESWYNHFGDGAGVIQFSPACTPLTLPNVELGGFVRHGWIDGTSGTGVGLTAKFELRNPDTGLGIALSPSVDYGFDIDRIATASLIVPVTLPVTATLTVNVNAGWQWVYLGDIHAGFFGAQADWQFAPGFAAMVEGFGRTVGKGGAQAGVRWTVAHGYVDLDLLGGRFTDGVSPTVMSFGITVRH